MKRSRRVVLMSMGAAALVGVLPAKLLAQVDPDPRLLRNSNPDRPRDDIRPSRGLPGNRFQRRLRAGG